MVEDYLFADSVPNDHQKYVDRLRKFLNDTAELNDLLEDKESTDLELYHCIIDTWDQLNTEFEPSDLIFNDLSEISWNILRQGSVLNVLVSKGILSARNTLTYNDSGGITVQDQDVYGRYMALFNMLVTQFRRGAQNIKRNKNINSGYGGSISEYYYNLD